jgi:phage tail-like protein
MPGGVIGTPRTFHKKFKYVVEIDGVASANFQKCSELSAEIGKTEYHEGGALIPDKSPGRVAFADVTLERGACSDHDLYDWFVECVDAAAGSGVLDPQYKRGVDIVQQDRDGSELRRWRLANAWPMKFVAGDWDNESDDNVIEKLTFTYDYFELATG